MSSLPESLPMGSLGTQDSMNDSILPSQASGHSAPSAFSSAPHSSVHSASVQAETLVNEHFPELQGEDDDEQPATNEDIELLQRQLQCEKASPEILHHQQDLIADMLELIKHQEGTVEELMDEAEEGTEERDTGLWIQVCQMEIDRLKFMLNHYQRIRLWKIAKHIVWVKRDEETQSRLTPDEMEFASEYWESYKEHFERSVLKHLPNHWTKFEENQMYSKPDKNHHCFVRITQDVGKVAIPPPADGDQECDLKEGDTWVLPYKMIRDYIDQQKVDLL